MINYRRNLSPKGYIILRTMDIYRETLPSLTHWYSMRKLLTAVKFLIKNCRKLSFFHPLWCLWSFHSSDFALFCLLLLGWPQVASKILPSHSLPLADLRRFGTGNRKSSKKKVWGSRFEIVHKSPDFLKIIFIEKNLKTPKHWKVWETPFHPLSHA